ncbi:MAG: hypothetical protein JNL33_08140 [Betaproteobacteria bacterium]|nr:hypothetical protein [Betaproteobacteria bacterium]
MAKEVDPVKTARQFESYVRNIWPWQRKFVGSRLHRRCTQCGASEKMLPLNASGICSECERINAQGLPPKRARNPAVEAELAQILAAAQGTGSGSYDALLMFSGGKDSTYLAQRMKNEHPRLRLLACTVDNSFMSPVAKRNIDEILPRLNIDHVFIRPRREFYVKLFRYAVTHLNAEGSYGTVDFSDGEFMLDSARNLAAEKGIPLIVCGYSRYQVENGLGLQHFESPRETERRPRTDTAGLKLEDMFDADERNLWWRGQTRADVDVPRLLFPLYAWDLEEAEIKRQVVEWGLIQDRNQSPIVTNHRLIPLLGVVDVHQFGYSSFEKEFCRMIREGKAEREPWQHTFEFLEYTSKTGLFVKPLVLDLLKELDLTTQDVGVKFD